MLNEEGSIKGHISDVVDKLNNLPFSGSATKRNNEIHYRNMNTKTALNFPSWPDAMRMAK